MAFGGMWEVGKIARVTSRVRGARRELTQGHRAQTRCGAPCLSDVAAVGSFDPIYCLAWRWAASPDVTPRTAVVNCPENSALSVCDVGATTASPFLRHARRQNAAGVNLAGNDLRTRH